MTWTRWATLAASAATLFGAALTLSCNTAQQASNAPAAMTPEQKIERGRYLATIAGCNDCHTPGTLFGLPDTTRRLAGSELGWQGPWGVSFARNLTSDNETGLGTWSEEDIVNALRTGQRPDKTPLMPPMPWPNTASLTDEDVHALAAYLKSLPAVSHKVPDRVAPGVKAQGSIIPFPAPSAWDAPKGPPAAAPPVGGGGQ